jgi:DNA recombination protein RmuC
MDTPLFLLGSFTVTTGIALVIGTALLFVLVLAAAVATMRTNARQALASAQATASELRSNFLAQIAERDGRLRQMDEELRVERARASQLNAEVAALRAQLSEQARYTEESLNRFNATRQQMTDEFKAIAGEVLKSHGETFSRQNREQVDVLLKPLNEKIIEFQTGMLKDRAAMTEQIRALAESNLQITTEANNLTRALKGNSQAQGAWGEMILSTILERSGLREGEQFLTQQSHSGEEGGRIRTDVEILMPNNDRLVIDSKVSLTAFEAYVNSNEDGRDLHLRAHITSIRNHIRGLGEKTYHRHAGSSLDYVMMFVPIESALATAIQADAKLVEYGMSQGVMLTTPTTLMTVLRTVRSIWDIEKRHQNAEEIASRAGSLYDKVVGFLGSMDKLSTNLDRAQQSFAEARGQLAGGKGSVVRQVEMLRELGAKSSKALPAGWAKESEDAPLLRVVGDEPADLR